MNNVGEETIIAHVSQGALEIDGAIIIEEEAGVYASEINRYGVTPLAQMGIRRGDYEVVKAWETARIGADYIKDAIVVADCRRENAQRPVAVCLGFVEIYLAWSIKCAGCGILYQMRIR